MKVTVYIPSKSYGKYLKQAVESVLSQTLEEWEILIICDGAVDDNEKIADEYRDICKSILKTKGVLSKETRGQYEEVNSLMRDFYEMFYKFDAEKSGKFSDKTRALLNKTEKGLEDSGSGSDKVVMHHLTNITRKIHEIAGPFYAMAL